MWVSPYSVADSTCLSVNHRTTTNCTCISPSSHVSHIYIQADGTKSDGQLYRDTCMQASFLNTGFYVTDSTDYPTTQICAQTYDAHIAPILNKVYIDTASRV